MDIEQLATGAIITALSKTERLRGFINSGDKEPCWDGNIYIHEDKKHSKKNIKKVATQVKGKLVKAGASKDTIKYPVSYDDLNAESPSVVFRKNCEILFVLNPIVNGKKVGWEIEIIPSSKRSEKLKDFIIDRYNKSGDKQFVIK